MKCQKIFEKEYGKELISLIKEYFQFYNMDYTNCVFASEANMRDEVKREVLALKLGIDKPDPEGLTPFMWVCLAGELKAAEFLIQCGCKVDFINMQQ